MAVKAYIWDYVGNGKRHLNEVEIAAIKSANADVNESAGKPKVDKLANKPAKKSHNRKTKAELMELKQAA